MAKKTLWPPEEEHLEIRNFPYIIRHNPISFPRDFLRPTSLQPLGHRPLVDK